MDKRNENVDYFDDILYTVGDDYNSAVNVSDTDNDVGMHYFILIYLFVITVI